MLVILAHLLSSTITATVMLTMIIGIVKRFPTHDELSTCSTSPVSPEQSALYIPIWPTSTTWKDSFVPEQ